MRSQTPNRLLEAANELDFKIFICKRRICSMFHTCTNVCDYRDTKRKWIHNRRGDLNKNIRLQKLGGLLVTYCIDLETENFMGYVNSHLFEM